jgi:hypothetical protein
MKNPGITGVFHCLNVLLDYFELVKQYEIKLAPICNACWCLIFRSVVYANIFPAIAQVAPASVARLCRVTAINRHLAGLIYS